MTHTMSDNDRIVFEKRVRGYHKDLGSLLSNRLMAMVKSYVSEKKEVELEV